MLAPRIPARRHLNASGKLGICWLLVVLLASGAGAETRIYGAAASNYVFRGFSWSDDRASASAGIDWQHRSGIYAGGNVTSVKQGVEFDTYAGYTQRFGLFAVDFGGSTYDYSDDDYIDGKFRELYVGGQAGPVGFSFYRGQSPFGSRYWYGEANAGLPVGPVTVELHYGLSEYASDRSGDEYVGFAARWRGLDWRVRVTHHEGDEDPKFVAAISRSWTVGR
jgi:uncharacterized protein (TIGR02001 family)